MSRSPASFWSRPRTIRRIGLVLFILFASYLWFLSSPTDGFEDSHKISSRSVVHVREDAGAQVPLVAGDEMREGPKRAQSRYNITNLWFPYTDKPRDDGWPRWEAENHRMLKELMACMIEGNCRLNQVRYPSLKSVPVY
jgi:hypothetical protein